MSIGGIFARALLWSGLTSAAFAAVPPVETPAARHEAEQLNRLPPVAPHGRAAIDHSGRAQRGKASFYARRFSHRKMADGRRMNPEANVAASKTLPLGTTATVTNLENGRSATVRVEDRGPFVDGRVVDLSPKVARDLEIHKQGVAPVVVKPITVPQPNGDMKLGAGAANASSQEIAHAAASTEAVVAERETQTAGR